ncbi:uncharacterized protein BDCG_05093 [Blastomyces dermatitidis ER-3]|nr:uncharacterized protein BDCG_05093 [Blastomyces dermatitidis ER-3]EEQ89973.1 hypothetical protein BDCG_05093 [Blastomyces dermatitidis ER-3]EQL37756.1 hypothetical protein BDFG_00806 [Blastomyces dermatitidis ATCC 26199]
MDHKENRETKYFKSSSQKSLSCLKTSRLSARFGAHLHAYHAYASDPTRFVEANHYCTMVNEDMRQCIIYDSPDTGARLIGIEYLISPKLYERLPEHEQVLWHSHVYEIKSGMLVMPPPPECTDRTKLNELEKEELSQLVTFYGKVYHLWQVDRGDELPMGVPELMGSITSDEALNKVLPGGKVKLREDHKSKFGVDLDENAEKRKEFGKGFEIHPNADSMWKKQGR